MHKAVLAAVLLVETGLESALFDAAPFDVALFDVALFDAALLVPSCASAIVKAKDPATIKATPVSNSLFIFQPPLVNPRHAMSRNRNPILD